MLLVEAAVETVRSARAAQQGGADRIELCAGLNDGGLTPSIGLIEATLAQVRIPVFAMIQPRPGGFAYDETEVEIMLRDIAVARETGVDGLVFGALTPDHRINVPITRRLLEAAGTMPVTFHRAFDRTPDLLQSLETLVELGISRVLTAGGAPSALEGVDVLRRLVSAADGRIHILAGGGVREHNAREIARRAGVRELHTRLVGGKAWEELDEGKMRELVRSLQS